MDVFVGVDTFAIGANQVWHFKVEIANFRSLFKPWIHYKLEFPAMENSQQQNSDQIKILHLYVWPQAVPFHSFSQRTNISSRSTEKSE